MNKLKRTSRSAYKFMFTLLIVILCGTQTSQAQNLAVSGTVTGSEDGMPIPGVAIIIKGSNVGAVTDFDGNYTIKAKVGDILEFSYLGMQDKSVKVTGEKLDVVLDASTEDLEEVVVVGYGAVKKKEVTGAVAQVKAEQIENFVTADLAGALQGQVAGVNVNSNGGEPGEPSSILIRGISSLSGTNNPLFVVDGVPLDQDPNLNPSEIETIDVLKDAASAAIYGTRGAGGVIIITTKRGKAGRTAIDVDFNLGVQNIPTGDFTPLLNASQQIFVDQTVGTNAGADSSRFNLFNNTNLVNNILKDNALLQRYNLRVSGGTDEFNFSVLGGYFRQEGIITGSLLNRYNMRANVRVNKNRWKINKGFGFTIDDRDLIGDGLIGSAIRYTPFLASLEDALEFPANGTSANRIQGLLGALANRNEQHRYRLDANLTVEYELAKGLSLTTSIGTAITHEYRRSASLGFSIPNLPNQEEREIEGVIREGSRRFFTINWNGGLNYNTTFGKEKKHSLRTTLLLSAERYKNISFAASRPGLQDNGIFTISNATGAPTVSSSETYSRGVLPGAFISPDATIARIGTIGRILYDYDKRYLVNISARRDASSQFGPNNRWKTFPSASVAWNLAEEDFWEPYKKVVNNFKIRASHGTTGNDRFASYQDSNTVRPNINAYLGNPVVREIGSAQLQLSNEDIQWETTIQTNVGFDLSLFKNALTITGEYYTTDKEDLLLSVINPISAGVSSCENCVQATVLNVGNMTNNGIEYTLRYRGKSKSGFSWNIGATYASNTNRVTELAGDTDEVNLNGRQLVSNIPDSKNLNLVLGEAAGSFLLYRTDGIFNTQAELDEYVSNVAPGNIIANPQLGDLKFVDVDGDGVITPDDREVRGSGLPEHEVGLNLNFDYKNLSLAVNCYGSFGNEVLNGARATAFSERRHRDLIYQYNVNNTDTNVPIWRDLGGRHPNFSPLTDSFLEDGSYVRITNVTLGYKFPKPFLNNLNVTAASIYVSGQNLATFTEYSGFDPGAGGNNIANRGVDNSRYPLARTFNLGMKLKF